MIWNNIDILESCTELEMQTVYLTNFINSIIKDYPLLNKDEIVILVTEAASSHINSELIKQYCNEKELAINLIIKYNCNDDTILKEEKHCRESNIPVFIYG